MSKHILVVNFQCIFGSVGQVVEKCNLHYCKEHILQMAVNSALLEIEASNFREFSQLLVCCRAYRKEHLTVHYGWSGNAMITSKIYSFLCEPLILAFCFALLVFFQNHDFLPTISHVPTLSTHTEMFDKNALEVSDKNVLGHIFWRFYRQ